MPRPSLVPALDELIERSQGLYASRQRTLLGIAGPPGAGKSTLAQQLVDALGPAAVLVPMDGFHLAQAELVRLGRADRKGAPDTFDAVGFVALLGRLRQCESRTYAPVFDRRIEDPIAGSIVVPAEVPLVVVEGNYLLLEDEPWRSVRSLLEECWYLEVDEKLRTDRLVRRHEAHGKSPQQARAWAHGSDAENAVLVAQTRGTADLQVRA